MNLFVIALLVVGSMAGCADALVRREYPATAADIDDDDARFFLINVLCNSDIQNCPVQQNVFCNGASSRCDCVPNTEYNHTLRGCQICPVMDSRTCSRCCPLAGYHCVDGACILGKRTSNKSTDTNYTYILLCMLAGYSSILLTYKLLRALGRCWSTSCYAVYDDEDLEMAVASEQLRRSLFPNRFFNPPDAQPFGGQSPAPAYSQVFADSRLPTYDEAMVLKESARVHGDRRATAEVATIATTTV